MPLETGYSPSELLMSRILRSTVPSTRKQRIPRVPEASSVRAKDEQLKARQKRNFDSHYGVRELALLSPGDTVWIPDQSSEAQVCDEVDQRLYEVTSQDGTFPTKLKRPDHSSRDSGQQS